MLLIHKIVPKRATKFVAPYHYIGNLGTTKRNGSVPMNSSLWGHYF